MAKAQKPAPYAVGDMVEFLGYSEETPESEQLLAVGTIYEVVEVEAVNEAVVVELENPDFNPKKKESEANAKMIRVDVFFDEVQLADGDGEAGAEAEAEAEEAKPAPTRAKAKPAVAAPAAKAAAKPAAKAATKAAAPAAKPAAKAATKGKAAAKPAAKGKAAAVEVEEDKYPALADEDADILELVEGSEDLVSLAQELSEDSAALDYRLGGVLYHIRLGKAYQAVDKRYEENGGFGLFMKEQLNIEYRKAMYLIDIYYKFNLYGIDAAKVSELGWTKCSRIAAVMDGDNAEELVELAADSTLSDLSDTIKESYSKAAATPASGERRKKIAFKFRLWEDQAESVKAILQGVTEQMGFKDPGDAFEHIITEWAAEHFSQAKKGKAATRAQGAARGAARVAA